MPRFLENTLKKTPSSGKSVISTYLIFFGWKGPEREWGWGGRLFEFEFEFEAERGGAGVGANSRLGASQTFLPQDGRLFEVGANSRFGAYSNKYGIPFMNQLCKKEK